MAGPHLGEAAVAVLAEAGQKDRFAASRRTLLGALVAAPVANLSAGAAASDWQRAVDRWRKAQAALAPVRRRFDATERLWFAARKGMSGRESQALAVTMGLDQAERDHVRHTDRCAAAFDGLLDTRAPDISAVIWKLQIVTDLLGSDVPEQLDFLLADLRSLDPNLAGGFSLDRASRNEPPRRGSSGLTPPCNSKKVP